MVRKHLIVPQLVVPKRGDKDDLVVVWVPAPYTLLAWLNIGL